jgi:hypothetical protein
MLRKHSRRFKTVSSAKKCTGSGSDHRWITTPETTGGQIDYAFALQELGLIWGVWWVHMQPGGQGVRPTQFQPGFPATDGHPATPKLRTFLEMGIFSPHSPEKCLNTPRSYPRGTGRIVCEPNEPKFAPKLPGVGFWHALACRGQAYAPPVQGYRYLKDLNSEGGR